MRTNISSTTYATGVQQNSDLWNENLETKIDFLKTQVRDGTDEILRAAADQSAIRGQDLRNMQKR